MAVNLPVCNRGYTRVGVAAAPEGPSRIELERRPGPNVLIGAREQHPWRRLQWWESELHAEKGITAIVKRPYLILPEDWRTSSGGQHRAVRTTTLYPDALVASDKRRIADAARYVAAMVRQAREYYSAADATGVTDLSRPVLYFYGALALAKAASTAIFGRDRQAERSHGLTFGDAPTASSARPVWPTLIKWQESGAFVRLYRAARWDDDLYRSAQDSHWKMWRKANSSQLPVFHILECLRWLGCDRGLLPPTGFEEKWPYIKTKTQREQCLLHYSAASDMYLRHDTPLGRPLFQAPIVVVRYMTLYYFSILARYYGLEWQQLLSTSQATEGYVFRSALEEVAFDYLLDMWHLLPRLGDEAQTALPTVTPRYLRSRPDISVWYRPPVEL